MEIVIYEQTYSFIVSVLSGLIIGIIYNFFGCLKSEFNSGKISKGIVDILFILSAFLFFFFSFFNFNGFNLRFYHIAGIFLGFILYYFTLKSIFCHIFKVFFKISEKILKILLYPLKFLCTIVYRIFVFFKKAYILISGYIIRFFTGRLNAVKKTLKRRKKY